MNKIVESITFLSPGCEGTFEFDLIGEYEFVPCPMCGTEFITSEKTKR